MLIQDKDTNMIIKFISIYLKETFNPLISITNQYDNSTVSTIAPNSTIICNGYCAYNYYMKTNSSGKNVCNFSLGYIYYVGGIATQTLVNTTTNTNIPTFKDSNNMSHNLNVGVSSTNECYLIKCDKNGKFSAKYDSKGNFLKYDTVALPIDTELYFSNSTCRMSDLLCSYIAMWLNSRYPTNVTSDDAVLDQISNDICSYFINGDIELNASKQPFDLDNLVISFLLGRTISPMSKDDDIAYVQKLLYNSKYSDYIPNSLGVWDNDLTSAILKYQTYINNKYININDNTNNVKKLLVSGYFDIYTEKYLIMEQGIDINEYSQI